MFSMFPLWISGGLPKQCMILNRSAWRNNCTVLFYSLQTRLKRGQMQTVRTVCDANYIRNAAAFFPGQPSSGCLLTHRRRTFISVCSLSAASVSTGRPGWYESLADSTPIHLTEDMLMAMQQVTGLPWWANIICTTVALRAAITLPLAAYQTYIIAKVENLQPEIGDLAKRLRYEVSVRAKQRGWSEKVARFHFKKNLRRLVSELYVRDNCHPFKASLVIWVQIPMWVFVSVALRNLSVAIIESEKVSGAHKELAAGGMLWFPDLTLPDSTWILPVLVGVVNLLIVEIFALRKLEPSKFQKYVTNFIRAISLVMIPIAATVPSSMALYWLSSSAVGLGQNLLLHSPTFRQLCRIPKAKSDSDTPYKDITAAFLTKYFMKK
ncbi:cytochrome c oxidase assembly protein COX18, mitochondrial [Latimeria chalumnae]|uniref:cytochrome c oxidase assembly protein COX18, mitochondrial n=1 Tax=Latimeria chalumnae TaxID=7897 RepID=UPI00313D4588